MKLEQAEEIAERIVEELRPHCRRAEIAGSIRRRKEWVRDIEIVCIPKPYDVGLFASGIATVVDRWPKVNGDLPCKYTQRLLPEGIKLDLFLATRDNWGLIYASRTGSADYSHQVLARGWCRNGYHSKDGLLWKEGGVMPVMEEHHLFNLCGLAWVAPHLRTVPDEKVNEKVGIELAEVVG